jgi:hypothetical protein
LANQDKKHQAELAAMQKAHADEIEEAKSSLSRTSADAEKYKQLHAEAEVEAAAAEKELEAFKAKAETWLTTLNKINSDMGSNCIFLFQFCRHILYADICLTLSYLSLFAENFPHSEPVAALVVKKARQKRAEEGPISAEWDQGDHLLTLQARLKPLQSFGVDMLQTAIRTFSVLWPGEDTPNSCKGLAEALLNVDDQLDEWRESAAHAGADEALSFILSWYEGINLDTLKAMRTGSKLTSDPELIAKWQETTYAIAQYAEMHKFIEDPNAIEVEGEDGAGVNAEDEVDVGSPVVSTDPSRST